MRTIFTIEINGAPSDTKIDVPTPLQEGAKAQAVAAANDEASRGARVSVYRVHMRWERREWVGGLRELVYTAPVAIAA